MKRKIKNSLRTRAEFAGDCKVSRAAVTKALAVGNIISHDGVHIDPDNRINEYFKAKSLAKAPIKAARKERQEKDKEILEEVEEYPADGEFVAMLEKLNDAKPKTLLDKIKNEVSFEIAGLFSVFNRWSGGEMDQDWIVEKCHIWTKSINDSIDQIALKKIINSTK